MRCPAPTWNWPTPEPRLEHLLATSSRWTRGPPWSLVAPSAEEIEQEQEDVEDVEEDACGDHDGAAGIGSAQAVEVEDGEGPEDPETRDGVDDVAVWDRDEDRGD